MKIVIHSGAGCPNIGDEAIVEGIVDFYTANFKDADIYLCSGRPEHTQLLHSRPAHVIRSGDALFRIIRSPTYNALIDSEDFEGLLNRLQIDGVQYFDNMDAALAYRALEDVQLFHIAGGGYFHSGFMHVAQIGCLMAAAARRNEGKLVLSGLTMGPFKSNNQHLFKEILTNAAVIDMRDERGHKALTDWGFEHTVTIDDAFAHTLLAKGGAPAPLRGPNPVVNVQMAGDRLARRLASTTSLVREYEKVIKTIKGVLPEAIIRMLIYCPTGRDHELARMVYDSLRDPGIELVDVSCRPLNFVRKVMGEALINVGSRFHFSVLSFCSLVPVFGLYFLGDGGDRTLYLYKQFDWDWGSELSKIDHDKLATFLHHFSDLDNRASFVEQTRAMNQKLHKRKLSALNNILAL